MSKPYDATSKYLIALQPSAWSRWFGYTSKSVKICNVDLSTITTSVDALLVVGRKNREGLHLEFQAACDKLVGTRILVYSVLATKILDMPIRSVLFLLRPAADHPDIDGSVRKMRVDGTSYLEFHYEVVRVWQLSSDALLNGELGLLPLAFIADAPPEAIPGMVKRAMRRLAREVNRETAGEIWTSIKVLMGMKFDESFIANSLGGAESMKESVTYQAIVREGIVEGQAQGKTEEAHKLLMRLGEQRFGKPSGKTCAAIKKIETLEELEDLVLRTLIVSDWKELLTK